MHFLVTAFQGKRKETLSLQDVKRVLKSLPPDHVKDRRWWDTRYGTSSTVVVVA